MRVEVVCVLLCVLGCAVAQLEGGTLCQPCLDESVAFFSVFENSLDVALIKTFIATTCHLFPETWEQQFCIGLGDDILERLEDDADSFFDTFTPYTWCTVAALCPCPCCVTNNPEQVHLSSTGNPSEMVVSWIQNQNVSDPFVSYHPSDNSGVTTQWTDVEVSTYWQGGWVGYIYQSVLTGLTPGQQYNYTVGSSSGTLSPGYVFSAPPITNATSDTTFAIYGDMGDAPSADEVMFVLREAVEYYDIDLILHAGDIAYTNGYQGVWDDWMRKMTPIAATVPYMAVEGNHEAKHFFAAYKHRFRMPYKESGSKNPKYFSYDYGNVHFVAFSFEDLLDLDNNPAFGIQHAWIEQDLQKVNTVLTPWIVAYAHRPLYCSADDASRCVEQAARYRHQLEDLFNQYNVTMVISGHNHMYERTYPVYKQVPTATNYENPTAPVYAVIGSAGRGLHYGWEEPAPVWSAPSSRISAWGFSVISTTGSSSFSFQWIEAYTSSVMDSFTITRS